MNSVANAVHDLKDKKLEALSYSFFSLRRNPGRVHQAKEYSVWLEIDLTQQEIV